MPAGASRLSSARVGARRVQSAATTRAGDERRSRGRLRRRVRRAARGRGCRASRRAPRHRPRRGGRAPRRCPGRSRSAASRTAARDDRERAEHERRRAAARRGTTSAIATATSGAAPTTTEVREAPTSRTASVKRICEPPGASRPASRNGQAPWRSWRTSAAATATASATRTVASAAPPASARPGAPSRSATVIPPNSAAEREQHDSRQRPPHESHEHACRAGSARTMPAMITAQPSQPTAPSRSPASVKPKNAAQTGSSENASAVCVARRAPLRPRLGEERERAREDAGHEQRAPDRPAVRQRAAGAARARSTSRPANAVSISTSVNAIAS